jgi:hypothetical protein
MTLKVISKKYTFQNINRRLEKPLAKSSANVKVISKEDVNNNKKKQDINQIILGKQISYTQYWSHFYILLESLLINILNQAC